MQKNPLSRLFVPQHLVYLDADLGQHWYKIARQLDGRVRLKAISRTKAKQPILVLDPGMPFRRRYQLALDRRFHRNALMAAADGMFPFPVVDGYFAIGEEAGSGYLYGIPRQQLDDILSAGVHNPQAILVSPAHSDSLHAALNGWLQRGSIADLLNGPKPINPALRSTLMLLTFTTLLLGGIWYNWDQQQAEQAELFQARYSKLRAEGEPLLTRYQAIKRMKSAISGLEELAAMPASTAQARLDMLLRALPEKTAIDRISYQDGRLKISGWGADPNSWLDLETGSFRLVEYNVLLNDTGRFQVESVEVETIVPESQ